MTPSVYCRPSFSTVPFVGDSCPPRIGPLRGPSRPLTHHGDFITAPDQHKTPGPLSRPGTRLNTDRISLENLSRHSGSNGLHTFVSVLPGVTSGRTFFDPSWSKVYEDHDFGSEGDSPKPLRSSMQKEGRIDSSNFETQLTLKIYNTRETPSLVSRRFRNVRTFWSVRLWRCQGVPVV